MDISPILIILGIVLLVWLAWKPPKISDFEPEGMPEWAEGRAHGNLVLGAQLPTRDGRRYGNAHIVGSDEDNETYEVLTDAGNRLYMSSSEIRIWFYPPRYYADVAEILSKFSKTKD